MSETVAVKLTREQLGDLNLVVREAITNEAAMVRRREAEEREVFAPWLERLKALRVVLREAESPPALPVEEKDRG